MKPTWVIQLDGATPEGLGALRLCEGVEIARIDGDWWLRGDDRQPLSSPYVRAAPAAARYRIVEGDLLVHDGRRVPTRRMPQGTWQSVRAAVSLSPPRTALPGRLTRRLPLTLRRAQGRDEPNVMRTNIDALAAFVDALPTFRIDAWRFAMNARGDALVIGKPLPSVAGAYLFAEEGIATPLGYTLDPSIRRAALRDLLGLAVGDMVLVDADGAWERVPAESLLAATRASIRLSVGEVARAGD